MEEVGISNVWASTPLCKPLWRLEVEMLVWHWNGERPMQMELIHRVWEVKKMEGEKEGDGEGDWKLGFERRRHHQK